MMMQKIRRVSTATVLVAVLGLMVYVGGVWDRVEAQGGYNRVQQDSQLLDAAIGIKTSATTGATLTIPGVAGQFVYVQQVDVANCAGAAAVTAAAPTTITTTNLPGSLAWTVGSGVTAGQCQAFPSIVYPKGLKSLAAGTDVTIVLPTFATNQTIRLNVAYSYGF